MPEVIEVKSKRPVVEAITVKFDRYEALEVIDLLDSAWKRNNYHFRFDGKPSLMYKVLYKALYGEDPKPKLPSATDAFNAAMKTLDAQAFLR